jgi:hypothetical protein
MSDKHNHQELQEQDRKDRDGRPGYVAFAGLAVSFAAIALRAFGLLEMRSLFVIVVVTASVVGLVQLVFRKPTHSRRT